MDVHPPDRGTGDGLLRVLPAGPDTYRVEGELDVSTIGRFEDALADVPRTGDLILDLSGLAFMDSSGLGVLLRVARRLQGDLVLRAPQPGIERALWLAGFGDRAQLRVRVEGSPPREDGSDFLRTD